MRFDACLRNGCLDDDDRRAVTLQVQTRQNLMLPSLDVDLEEIDRATTGVLVEDVGQWQNRHRSRRAVRPRGAGDPNVERRKLGNGGLHKLSLLPRPTGPAL